MRRCFGCGVGEGGVCATTVLIFHFVPALAFDSDANETGDDGDVRRGEEDEVQVLGEQRL